jgi:hypothetical protein
MDLNPLKQIYEQKAQDAVTKQRHDELLLDNTKTQEIIVKSISRLVDFMDNKVTKTEVVNQLREIGTPDVQKVVEAVNQLDSTIKSQEQTDLTEITKVLQEVLSEAKQIPKSHNVIDIPEAQDYSGQLKALESTVQAVEKAIKAQELKVEAPVVNVPETQVNIEAVDLKPIEKSVSDSSKEVVKAVKGIKIPELNTTPIEKLLQKTNKLLDELPDLMPSGGGGGGSSWVAVNEDGTPIPLNTVNGGLTTESVALATRIDDTADPIIYIGKAAIGSSTASAVWQITKLDTSSGLIKTWADSDSSFNNVWDNRASLSYS